MHLSQGSIDVRRLGLERIILTAVERNAKPSQKLIAVAQNSSLTRHSF